MSNMLSVNRTVSVTGAVEISSHNVDRSYMLIQNLSADTIYISLGQPLSAAGGIRLQSSGGAYEINAINLFKGRIYAYPAAGGGDVSTVEW